MILALGTRGLLNFVASECTLNVSIDSGDLHIFTVKSLGLTGAVSAFARVAGLEGSQVAARVICKQASSCLRHVTHIAMIMYR